MSPPADFAMKRMLLLILTVIALIMLLVWAGQRRAIYLPFGDTPSPGEYGVPDAEQVTIPTADGVQLGAWLVPPRAPATGVTVIVFNGNAGHRGFRAPLAIALAERGFATLLLDYRGFGGNPGSPSQSGLAADARAARAWLEARAGIEPSRIAYFGESLGTGVAVQLAAERSPAALVLRSPFTSLADIGRLHYPFLPVGLLLRDRFDSIEAIRRVRAPLLVIAGERDHLIPAANSAELFAAANDPKQLEIIPGADHNDMSLLAGRQMLDAIVDFLTRTVTATVKS